MPDDVLIKPNESNLLLCHRKKRRIDNTRLRFGLNRRASFTFASQRSACFWRLSVGARLRCSRGRAGASAGSADRRPGRFAGAEWRPEVVDPFARAGGDRIEIARVATSQINHLVSQTEGKFEDPSFRAPEYFNKENISRIAIEHQPIALENKWKANYSAFDFAEHLGNPPMAAASAVFSF